MFTLNQGNQDTIYPIMGDAYNSADCTVLQLDDSVRYRNAPLGFDDLQIYLPWFLKEKKALIAIGGYGEKRNLYQSSSHFSNTNQNRNIHLGIDVWIPAGTKIYAPIKGKIHSFAFNNKFLDYGYTLILSHESGSQKFHTLYGHLGAEFFKSWVRGSKISAGTCLAQVGGKAVNGGWYPHLHFQVIHDMGGWDGDYPGVCTESEKDFYLKNCPDPMPLIKFSG